MTRFPFLVVALVAGLLLSAAPAQAATGKVVSVVDGDTAKIKIGKRTRAISLLGVKAPTGSACFAGEARTKLRSLLRKGKKVRVVFDGSSRTAYVFAGSRFVNREMLSSGHARLGEVENLDREGALTSAARAAETAKRGLWACGATPGPAGPTPSPSPPAPPAPAPETGVDTAANRSAFDALFRGFRLTVHNQSSSGNGGFSYSEDLIYHFCTDGTYLFDRIFVSGEAGNQHDQATGTWKVENVTQKDPDGAWAGNLKVMGVSFNGGAPEDGFLFAGRTADGTSFIRVGDTDRLASRAAGSRCS